MSTKQFLSILVTAVALRMNTAFNVRSLELTSARIPFSTSPSLSLPPRRLPMMMMTTAASILRSNFDIVSYSNVDQQQQQQVHRAEMIERQRRDWVDQSIRYYSKVMREERRKNLGQLPHTMAADDEEEMLILAKKHYFALRKIKEGKPAHAERIYQRIIHELLMDDDGCDHSKLAITTLLLALHMQREGKVVDARKAFLQFFRFLKSEPIGECACSAKVMQAFALFEMKQGNKRKAFELVLKAIELDSSLATILAWKQFREVGREIKEEKKQHNSGNNNDWLMP